MKASKLLKKIWIPLINSFHRRGDIYIGINTTEAIDAYEFGIICENDYGDEEVTSLIPPKTKEANSLFDKVLLKRSSMVVNLEAFLLKKIEKRWSSKLNTLMDEIKAINNNYILDLLKLIDGFKFYLVGISYMDLFDRKGCSLCKPAFSDGILEMFGIEYPHFAVSNQGSAIKNDVVLPQSRCRNYNRC